MDNKKITIPKLNFSDVENRWESTKLGEVSKVVRGGSPRPISEYLTDEDDGLNWLKIGDIAEGAKYIEQTSEKIKKQGENMTRQIHPGDFILSNSMSFGRPYISKINTCIHDGWIAITEINPKIDSDYLYYFISSDVAQSYFNQMAAGSGVKNLNAEIIQNLIIHYPSSIIHSKEIASCLSSLDEVIAAHSQKLELLKDHKKGLMQNLFPQKGKKVPKLRFEEFEGEWEEKKLGEVAEIERGKSKHRPRNAKFLYGGKYPFIQTGDIKKADLYLTEYTQTYSEEGLKQSKIWDENTLCITIAANIAETAILRIKACFPDSIIGVIPHKEKANVLFIKFLFDSFKEQIQSFSQGVAQDNLNQEKLSNLKFLFPSLAEQQKIASTLSSLDELITAQTEKIEQLKEHKKGLMQGLFPKSITN